MTGFKVGDVLSVEFPFSDLQGQKRRPGLVLATDDNDVLLARLTTHAPRGPSDVALQQWTATGLPRGSTVRLTKLVTIDCRLIHHRIGHVLSRDAEALSQAMQALTAGIVTELRK